MAYAVLMVIYRMGWSRQKQFRLPGGYVPQTKISVIIPARNEEQNIAACINSVLAQDYPEELLQVIVVDDHSTDRTAEIVRTYPNVVYIDLQEHIPKDEKRTAYKKLALATGINMCNGELVVTTDADCTAGREWLKYLAARYETQNPAMIVAPVDYTYNNTMVQVFQSLDFMSMQGITVATLQFSLGNMSNGANLAFKREVYFEVKGYEGVDHIASGDDYLLMMKISRRYPGAITYLKAKEAIVSTPPQTSWAGFFNQRIRWASKSGKYDDKKLTSVLILVYLFNFSFLVLGLGSLWYPHWGIWLLGALIIKAVSELIYLIPVARFFNKSGQLALFLLLEPVHISYVIIAGFLGMFGKYRWKGRKVK